MPSLDMLSFPGAAAVLVTTFFAVRAARFYRSGRTDTAFMLLVAALFSALALLSLTLFDSGDLGGLALLANVLLMTWMGATTTVMLIELISWPELLGETLKRIVIVVSQISVVTRLSVNALSTSTSRFQTDSFSGQQQLLFGFGMLVVLVLVGMVVFALYMTDESYDGSAFMTGKPSPAAGDAETVVK